MAVLATGFLAVEVSRAGDAADTATRANALEDNFRLYFVKNGRRQQIATWSGTVVPGAWHDYRVEARGDHFQVRCDGAKVLDHHGATSADAGRIGVWTKADAVSYFDDLTVDPL